MAIRVEVADTSFFVVDMLSIRNDLKVEND
jgi:hypothetical protein